MPEPYGTLADVYDWLVPEAVLTPEGSVAAFAAVVDELPAGARVLDCAAGTGPLAVGLALRGFDVAATDASDAMIARTRALAGRRGVALDARVCAWEALGRQGGPRRSTRSSASATRSRTPPGPPRAGPRSRRWAACCATAGASR